MAQSDKRENSVLFSLRELRQIEESRVKEEESAVRAAEEARVRAREEAERRARDEEEAKVRAERDHQRAVEEARVAAEREARLRVEAAEAAERARQQAALEQQRLQQEMELRRAEVAKKRPTWMLAVTAIAVIGVVIAGVFTVRAINQSREDNQKRQQAEIASQQAVKEAQEATDKVSRLQADLEANTKQVADAQAALTAAQNDADRRAAQARLDELNHQQAEIRQRAAEAKAAAALAKRKAGVHLNPKCANNPLAEGCS